MCVSVCVLHVHMGSGSAAAPLGVQQAPLAAVPHTFYLLLLSFPISHVAAAETRRVVVVGICLAFV